VKYDISFLCAPQHHMELPDDVWEVEIAEERYTSEDSWHEVHTDAMAATREQAMDMINGVKRLVQGNIRKRKTVTVLREYRKMVEFGYPKAQVYKELQDVSGHFGAYMHPTPDV
jgi:hypothetical protein